MADIEFIDNHLQVNRAIDDEIGAFLLEVSAELIKQIVRNLDEAGAVDTGQLKGSFAANVDESKGEAVIGSPLANAIYTEFGTGEYAIKDRSPSGYYWVYVKGSGKSSSLDDNRVNKRYPLAKAKQIVAMMRDDGLDAYYTSGKKPVRMMHNAFEKRKKAIIRDAQRRFKARFDD